MAEASPLPFRVSLIILDVDGTLVDFVGAQRPAIEVAARRLTELTGKPVTPATIQAARDDVVADPEWRGRTLLDIRHESFRRVLESAVADSAALAGEVAALFFEARDRAMTVYPDVVPALEALTARGFSLAAASNGNMDLGAVGLSHYFTEVYHAEAIGFAKPDPRFFEHIVREAGGTPSATLAVGDRVDNDYEPARAAGLHAVLLDRTGRATAEVEHRIETLTKLPDIVERA